MKIELMKDKAVHYYVAAMVHNDKVIVKEGFTIIEVMQGVIEEIVNQKDTPVEALLNQSKATGMSLCDCLAKLCVDTLGADKQSPVYIEAVVFLERLGIRSAVSDEKGKNNRDYH